MAEIRWIDRDSQGRICGHYACKQREGQESLPADAPEILARDAAIKAEMDAAMAEQPASVKELGDRITALEARIAKLEKAKAPSPRKA